jgi:hypothetical protein
MSGNKPPESRQRSHLTLIHSDVLKAALDSTVEPPEVRRLPETMSSETARELVESIDHYVRTEAIKQERPSLAARRLVTAINRSGAELMLELMNSGNQLPPARDITRLAERLRGNGHELFPTAEQNVAINSPTQADLARTLQAHALAMQATTVDLTQTHRVDMEDAALAIWGMVGQTVESQDGLLLNAAAQAALGEIQSSYEEANRFRTVE